MPQLLPLPIDITENKKKLSTKIMNLCRPSEPMSPKKDSTREPLRKFPYLVNPILHHLNNYLLYSWCLIWG